jgi:hypothetical protein
MMTRTSKHSNNLCGIVNVIDKKNYATDKKGIAEDDHTLTYVLCIVARSCVGVVACAGTGKAAKNEGDYRMRARARRVKERRNA